MRIFPVHFSCTFINRSELSLLFDLLLVLIYCIQVAISRSRTFVSLHPGFA